MHFRGCANQKVKTLLCRAAVENRPRNVIFGTPSWSACQHDSMSKWATKLSSRNFKKNSVSPNCSWTRIKPWSRFIFYANGKGWKSEEFTQRGISVARWSRRRAGKKRKDLAVQIGSRPYRRGFNGCAKTVRFSVPSVNSIWMASAGPVTRNFAKIPPQRWKKSGAFWE